MGVQLSIFAQGCALKTTTLLIKKQRGARPGYPCYSYSVCISVHKPGASDCFNATRYLTVF